MDFMEMLQDKINAIPTLPIKCKLGYLGAAESLVLYPLPGSRATMEYMDGTKDWQMNYEFAVKSKLHKKVNDILWILQNELENLKTLDSQDGSFEFDELIITNNPFLGPVYDEQGWVTYLLDVQANITVFKEEKIDG